MLEWLEWIMKPQFSLTTRSSLLARLKDLDDEVSWQDFNRIYREFVKRLALRSRLSEYEAEDVVQEVLVSVARHIGRYRYNRAASSFRHWLTAVIRWRIGDQRRRQLRYSRVFTQSLDDDGQKHPAQCVNALPAASIAVPPGEEEWGRSLVQAALNRVKDQVSAKQYQIYYLHVLNERPVAEVCRRLKVNRGQVYLAKHRVGRQIAKEIQALRDR